MYNKHKAITATPTGLLVSYRDTYKNQWITYEAEVEKVRESSDSVRDSNVIIFNDVQQRLFSEVIHGLNYYPTEEVKMMTQATKNKITNTFFKAQRILNAWKQEVINIKINSMLVDMFPKSTFIKDFVNVEGHDNKYFNNFTFRDLGLNRRMIADKLIVHSLLPNNFYQLSVNKT